LTSVVALIGGNFLSKFVSEKQFGTALVVLLVLGSVLIGIDGLTTLASLGVICGAVVLFVSVVLIAKRLQTGQGTANAADAATTSSSTMSHIMSGAGRAQQRKMLSKYDTIATFSIEGDEGDDIDLGFGDVQNLDETLHGPNQNPTPPSNRLFSFLSATGPSPPRTAEHSRPIQQLRPAVYSVLPQHTSHGAASIGDDVLF
jgi:hypothetical protein